MNAHHDAALAMPESAATPAVAAIYADIREATGAPFVTSVWRVLAADEVTLRAAWSATAPFIDPHGTNAALAAISLPVVHRIEHSDAASAVVRMYTTVNATVMRGLSRALDGSAPTPSPTALSRSGDAGTIRPAVAERSLPTLLARSELSGEDLAAVDRIDQMGAASGTAPLHATIWRHLASAAPGVAPRLEAAMAAVSTEDIRRVSTSVTEVLTRKTTRDNTCLIPDDIRSYLRYYATDPHVTPRVVALGLIASASLSG